MRELEIVTDTTTGELRYILTSFMSSYVGFSMVESTTNGVVAVYPNALLTGTYESIELPDQEGKFKFELGVPVSLYTTLKLAKNREFTTTRIPVQRAYSTKGVPYYACMSMFGEFTAVAERWLRPKEKSNA